MTRTARSAPAADRAARGSGNPGCPPRTAPARSASAVGGEPGSAPARGVATVGGEPGSASARGGSAVGCPPRTAPASRPARAALVVALAAMLLVGCGPGAPGPTPTSSGPTSSTPAPTAAGPTARAFPAGPALPAATDDPQDVATGLDSPWGIAFLPGGSVLVTERDTAQVLWLTADGATPLTGPGADDLVAGTVHGGEGGLLGIAVSPTIDVDGLVYLYRTTADGNEVVRAELAADGTLGPLQRVLGGIPAAEVHDGGRIAFGPDGLLYVTTGDATQRDLAQDPGSLAGKILRLTPDGEPATGNPFPDSPVWSLGHRNVQGIAWDASGRMFASEFGQGSFDELNVIVRGGNYGWPVVEGRGGAPQYVDPVVTWSPAVASPSGITTTDLGVYLAALRGERLWGVGFLGEGFADAGSSLVGELGRLRDVVLGPDGALWLLTSNTDGRGDPRAGDDRLVRIRPH